MRKSYVLTDYDCTLLLAPTHKLSSWNRQEKGLKGFLVIHLTLVILSRNLHLRFSPISDEFSRLIVITAKITD